MEAQLLLRDPEMYPANEVLKEALGDTVYTVLAYFFQTITHEEYGLTPEWRFYTDGKAWLCKIGYKKKTILWLSIWEGFFKTSFFFTEKHLEGIASLDISEVIKDHFAKAKPNGRLIPMIIDVKQKGQLEDLLRVIRYRLSFG